MLALQKTKLSLKTQPIPANVSLTTSIAQSSGATVPQDAINLMCKVDDGEISADQAIAQIIQSHS
ncbi:MAG: hypothetical protein ACI8WB_003445 [Phenylobacterium sp.]|jgi:hypothetical protein